MVSSTYDVRAGCRLSDAFNEWVIAELIAKLYGLGQAVHAEHSSSLIGETA